eukprot:NODE_3992_length_721_cov_194.307808.p3 GENE.NODE_3992_length_721_cov_194.307808~~NODE_3992_length_721_cov_194.307808.p3  ORF type:complete len:68 (-),score=10.02 NODE_3992_length_721_cov_194.307808:368-571(-)
MRNGGRASVVPTAPPPIGGRWAFFAFANTRAAEKAALLVVARRSGLLARRAKFARHERQTMDRRWRR